MYIPHFAIFDKKDVIFPVKQIRELMCQLMQAVISSSAGEHNNYIVSGGSEWSLVIVCSASVLSTHC